MAKKVKDISLFTDNASNLPDGKLAITYVVLKAIADKDKLAMELLKAAGCIFYDAEGNIIFPVQEKDASEDGNDG